MYRFLRGVRRIRVSIPIALALLLLAGYVGTNFTHCAQCGALTWKSGSRVYEDYDHNGKLVWYCPKCNAIGKAKFGGGDEMPDFFPWMH